MFKGEVKDVMELVEKLLDEINALGPVEAGSEDHVKRLKKLVKLNIVSPTKGGARN